MSAVESAASGVREGRTTAAAAAKEVASRLEKTAALNASLNWSAERLEAEAARVDGATPSDRAKMPLAGVPIAVKDNIVTTEQPTTCGSRILEGYVSPFNATVINRLRAAGAMIACKANLDEFAMGSSTEHSAFGRVKHPDDPSCVPGGSSGGSASAAVCSAGVLQGGVFIVLTSRDGMSRRGTWSGPRSGAFSESPTPGMGHLCVRRLSFSNNPSYR